MESSFQSNCQIFSEKWQALIVERKMNFEKKDGFGLLLTLIWDFFPHALCIPYRGRRQWQLLNGVIHSISVHFMCFQNALSKILPLKTAGVIENSWMLARDILPAPFNMVLLSEPVVQWQHSSRTQERFQHGQSKLGWVERTLSPMEVCWSIPPAFPDTE